MIEEKNMQKPLTKEEEVTLYLHEGMNGWEAYRALELCLERWYAISKDEYLEFLLGSLHCDAALIVDFAKSVRDTILEREPDGHPRLAFQNSKSLPLYKPCECQKNK